MCAYASTPPHFCVHCVHIHAYTTTAAKDPLSSFNQLLMQRGGWAVFRTHPGLPAVPQWWTPSLMRHKQGLDSLLSPPFLINRVSASQRTASIKKFNIRYLWQKFFKVSQGHHCCGSALLFTPNKHVTAFQLNSIINLTSSFNDSATHDDLEQRQGRFLRGLETPAHPSERYASLSMFSRSDFRRG